MRKHFFIGIAASLLFFAGCETTEIVVEEPEPELEPEPEVIVPINNPEPLGLVEVLDGFEEGLYWLSASGLDGDFGGDISIDADTTDFWSSEGDYSCALVFASDMDEKSMATFGCDSLFFNDFTGYTDIYLDINNTAEEGLGFALAISDTGGVWCESTPIKLGPGMNRNVKISLDEMEIPDVSAVRYLYLRLFPKSTGELPNQIEKIFVDNNRIVKYI